jgi:hypothetical protein
MRLVRHAPLGAGFLVLALQGVAPAQGVGFAAPSAGVENLAKSTSDSADSVAALKPDTIQYSGDELDYDTELRRLVLSGKARLEYRGTILSADSVYYDQETGFLEAAGSPDVKDPTIAPFKAERLRYNLKTRRGVMYQGRSEENGDFYRGGEIRRNPDRSLEVLDGDFCQCKGQGDPDYWFASARMAIDPDEQAVGAPVVLNVAQVPVAVVPFVLFPLGKERRSGLLAPKLGGDQRQGFYARNVGAYWGISDYADLTASSDLVEGERGRFDQASGTMQLRYKRRYWLDGNVSWKQHLEEFGSKGSGWEARYSHDQQLVPEPDKATIKGDGAFVSNRTVRSDNALSAEEILDQTANANLTGQYRWKRASATLSASQTPNLRTGLRTRELPAFTLNSSGQVWAGDDDDPTESPSLLQSIRYGYQLRTNRYEDRKADREFDSTDRPRDVTYNGATQTGNLTASQTVFDHLKLGASFNARHDWTSNSYAEDPVTGRWRRFDPDAYDPDQAFTWNTGVTAGTDIYGIWLPYWGRFGGLRHTVSPTVGYTFYPHIDKREYFVANPRLGQSSGQSRSRLVSISLGQKLDAKLLGAKGDTSPAAKKGTALSLLSVNSSTGYDLEKDLKPWSDITSTYNTGLLQAVDLNGSFVHSLYDRFSADSTTEGVPVLESWSVAFSKGLAVSGSLSNGFSTDTSGSPWNTNLSYSYTLASRRVSREVFQSTRTQSLSMGAMLHPTKAWEATWRSTYNFDEGTFVSHDLAFKRPLGCWDLTFGWIPVGPARGWNFLIQIRDVPDVKLQATSTTIRKVREAGGVKRK